MLASHSCSLLVFSKNRHSELNSERKLELTVLAFKNVIVINFSPNWRSSNTDTPHDITHFNTFILIMCTDIRWLSIINCLLIAKKEMSGYLKQMFIAFVIKLFNMWTFLFSLFYHTYILAIIVIQSKHIVSGKRPYILQLSFSKSILNYAPNTVASYSFIFISQCCFSNCASWCAWFFYSFAVTSLGFKWKIFVNRRISSMNWISFPK